jgi:hypothetical protein
VAGKAVAGWDAMFDSCAAGAAEMHSDGGLSSWEDII